MSIVVDLPAPFGPSRATVSPRAIEMSTPATARIGPCGVRKVFSRPFSSMPGEALMPPIVPARPAAPVDAAVTSSP